MSKTVLAVESYITEQHKLASALTNNLASVSLMMNQLQKITDSLGKNKSQKKTTFSYFDIYLATTEKVFSETEQQLAILEDLMKDVHLEDEIKEYDTKLACLQEQKFEDLQKLKSKFYTFKCMCIKVNIFHVFLIFKKISSHMHIYRKLKTMNQDKY